MEKKEFIRLEHICRRFGKHEVLRNVDYTMMQDDFILIEGPSGSGKSTLLNIIGLLDKADEGSVYFDARKVQPFTKQANLLLRTKIGYLFQNFALMEDETVERNLKIALTYSDKKITDIDPCLREVGLDPAIRKNIVRECSGGEQQRIAMARLLLKPCSVILADEPTGSLDLENRDLILQLLKTLHDAGKVIIVASHDPVFKEYANKVIHLDKLM